MAAIISSSSSFMYPVMSLPDLMKTEKYAAMLAQVRRIPKVELGANLGCLALTKFVWSATSSWNCQQLVAKMDRIKLFGDYSEVADVLAQIRSLFKTENHVRYGATLFCQEQAADCVERTEIRADLKNLETGVEGYLKAILTGLENGKKDFQNDVYLILNLPRNTPNKEALEIVQLAIKYRDERVVGIAISGEGDCSTLFEAVDLAHKNAVPLTLDIGKKADESPEQQMKELHRIRPKRIGYAVHLCDEAKEWVDRHRPVIEVSIKSALSDKAIQIPREHPCFEMIRKEHKVVFCSGNSTLSGDLSSELAVAACVMDWPLSVIERKQKEAASYLHSLPTYTIFRRVLEIDDFDLLKRIDELKWQYPLSDGRLRIWQECFHTTLKGNQEIYFSHDAHHLCVRAIDNLARRFLRMIRTLDPSVTYQTVSLEITVDRNTIHHDKPSESRISWHRDRFLDKHNEGVPDYSMVYLSNCGASWKGGDLLLQKGGEPKSESEWNPSKNPILHYALRFNEAIVFHNSHSSYSIEPITPILDWTRRDIVIMTAKIL